MRSGLREINKVFALLSVCAFVVALSPVCAFADETVKIHVLPFSYSDAIIIESDGHFGMVDAGEDADYPSGSDSRYPLRPGTTIGAGVEQEAIAYMRSIGVTSDNLDFFIGTHPHSDHIGGADEIIYEFQPKAIYTPFYSDLLITNPDHLWDNQYVYDRLVEAAEWAESRGSSFILFLGDENDPEDADLSRKGLPEFSLGNARIEIVNYSTLFMKTGVPDANYYSYGVRVVAPNGKSAFLSGDINNYTGGEKSVGDEDELAETLRDVDFLKLGHHGNGGSNTANYLRAILRSGRGLDSPVVMQTGSYAGMPFETVDTLLSLGARYFNVQSVVQAGQKALVVSLGNDEVSTNLDNEGYILQMRSTAPGGHLYYGGFPVLDYHGWVQMKDGWRYLDLDGSVATGWRYVDDAWYYLSPQDGLMQTGWHTENGAWYLLGANGALHVGSGWERIDGRWYYYQPGSISGAVFKGWLFYGGCWYYLDSSTGVMATGWAKAGDTWYYMNGSGVMQTGWLRSGGAWYFLDPSGAMAEGWLSQGGKWYYLAPGTGVMAAGWAKAADTWYYMNGSGVMQANKWIGNYYLLGSGAMATNQWIGQYYVGEDGLWIPGYRRTTN